MTRQESPEMAAAVASNLVKIAPMVGEWWDKGLDVWVGGSAVRVATLNRGVNNDIDLYGTPDTCKIIKERHGIAKRGWYSVDLAIKGEVKYNLCDGIEIYSPEEYLKQVDFSACAAMVSMKEGKPLITAVSGWLDDITNNRTRYIKPLNAISTQSMTRLLKLSRQGFTTDPRSLASVVTALLNSMPYKKHMGAPETRDALTEMFSAFETSVPTMRS